MTIFVAFVNIVTAPGTSGAENLNHQNAFFGLCYLNAAFSVACCCIEGRHGANKTKPIGITFDMFVLVDCQTRPYDNLKWDLGIVLSTTFINFLSFQLLF